MSTEYTRPGEIEARSFAILSAELKAPLPPENAPVIKRVIHTTADFDYAENLVFSPDAVEQGVAAFRAGAVLVTDTNMAKAGVSKPALAKCGGEALCFVADADVAEQARQNGTTRAVAALEKAAALQAPGGLIFAFGNAPTGLAALCDAMGRGLRPRLVIGTPVGFVNVVESKELAEKVCKQYHIPYIIAHGRKGGSNVAAAICNALLYLAVDRRAE